MSNESSSKVGKGAFTTTQPQHPIAAEMAAFEWALSLAFDAEDASILSLQDLAEIPQKIGQI